MQTIWRSSLPCTLKTQPSNLLDFFVNFVLRLPILKGPRLTKGSNFELICFFGFATTPIRRNASKR
jgi:hypothetical protein